MLFCQGNSTQSFQTMNLLKALLQPLSKANDLQIVGYIEANPGQFEELMKLFFAGPYRITQRASGIINYCAERNRSWVQPYLGRMIQCCKGNVHDAVKRNTVRILQFVPIPEELEGEVLDLCFDLLGKSGEAVATKAFAMTVAGNLCQKYPELALELKILIEDRMPYESPAFTSRGRKVLKNIGVRSEEIEVRSKR